MERRTFLKGAVIAASTPAVVLAPTMAAVTLGSLIAQYDEIDALYNASDALEGELAKRGDRPEFPHIKMAEFAPYAHGWYKAGKCCFNEEGVNALFDREVEQAEKHFFGIDKSLRETRLAQIAKSRGEALALFRTRQARYDAWKQESGLSAVQAETTRLADLLGNIEDKIMALRPSGMEDVKTKAAFFHRAYADNPPERFVVAFMQSLMA
ncbi:hypothetical protein [Agrobacterium radiobacter]|uniref:hypothetical protein n=1 Tax=Agrobacterium radiobacter TaxID=362 RepID=UPI003CEB8328